MFRRVGRWLRRTDTRGQAMVELALLLPVILLILMGITEFGRAYYTYLSLQHAAREGARLGVTGATDAAIIDRVREAAALDPDFLSVTIVPAEGSRRRGDMLEVDLQYNFSFLVPLISDLVGDNVQLRASLRMRME